MNNDMVTLEALLEALVDLCRLESVRYITDCLGFCMPALIQLYDKILHMLDTNNYLLEQEIHNC